MKTVICATAKNENAYINEWCNYYIALGFSHIYIYDNNDLDVDYVGNFITEAIKPYITIIDIRGQHEENLQHQLYQAFYNKYNKTFDWCLFCDIDEFLTGIDNINSFLEQPKFKAFDQIRIKWKLFGDDNKLYRNTALPLINTITIEVVPNSDLAVQGKFILKGNLENIKIHSCHHAKGIKKVLNTCLPSGKICTSTTYQLTDDYTAETVFLNHYMTKTLSEFINQKYYRGDCVYVKRQLTLDYFWQLNTKSSEKLNFAANCEKIDLVVPYVDATDPNWQKIFLAERRKHLKIDEATAANRFRSQGNFFRYFFRCIEKNLPWINNVFLLVQSKSQVPDWIDTTKVHIITHDQFIPKKYLPTFNSGEIEMFIQNIPGLSEHFLYTNDDIYALKPMSKKSFFDRGYCAFNYLKDTDSTRNEWRKMCQNNHDLIFNTTNAVPYIRLDHEFRPLLKSKMIDCFNTYQKNIEQSISEFRSSKNLTIYLFSLYLLKHGFHKNTNLKIGYSCSTSSEKEILNKLNTMDSLCLNDTSTEIDIYNNQTIRYFFFQHYGQKSKYELNDDPSLATEAVQKNKQEKKDIKADGRADCFLYF